MENSHTSAERKSRKNLIWLVICGLFIAAMINYVVAAQSRDSTNLERPAVVAPRATNPPTIPKPQPTTTTAPPTTTIAPTTSNPSEADLYNFVANCVDYFKTSAFLGDPDSKAVWKWAGESSSGLRHVYTDIAREDPARRTTIEADYTELTKLLASIPKQSPPVTTRPTPPTTVVRGLPPVIQLDCGVPYAGNWDWFRMEFGYYFDADAMIVEWGIDYGDGNRYTEAKALADLYRHKYWSDGSFNVTAWVVDEFGRRAIDSCILSWTDTSGSYTGGGEDDDYYDDGDLDCEDVGEEVWVGDDDPDNLDGDGDGWGCEAYG